MRHIASTSSKREPRRTSPDVSSLPQRAADISRLLIIVSIIWAGCLPLLIPFGAYRNIDLQGLVLILAGASAWGALLLDKSRLPKLGTTVTALLAVFAAFCILAIFVTPHLSYNLLGSPYIRLGSLGLLSCMGVALLLCRTAKHLLARYLYWYIVVVAVASAIYGFRFGFVAERIGGVFAQSDILACIMGCGLLLGWQFCSWKSWTGRLYIVLQLAMSILLFLTQTRAVLGLTVLLSCWLLFRSKQWRLPVIVAIVAGLAICAVLAVHLAPHNRLHNAQFAKESVSYRLDLNRAALSASLHRPVAGYGPGNLADSLDCKTLHAPSLLQTCRQGFFFNSSHNIYIDRTLGLGWLAGLAYLALVITSLIRGRQMTDMQAVRLLIALYYLTNVTNITIELLFWVVLIQGLVHGRSKNI